MDLHTDRRGGDMADVDVDAQALMDRYYFTNVIGGPGAFVMTANDYAAYRLAILAKLVKEISGPPTAARPLWFGRLSMPLE